jgi:signal transduction histidine kinase
MGTTLERPFGGHVRPLILVVEDNPEINHFVCETLGREYRTAPAYSGQEGIEKAILLRPDLVISNVLLPIASGDRLIVELRRRPELDKVPIVLLTAQADDEERARLLREGAQDYLMKPFSVEELMTRAATLVTLKRVRDLLEADIESDERDLEQLARTVAQRNRHLAAALDATRIASEQAERSSQLKTDFLGVVTHELQTPLSALQMQLGTLTGPNATRLGDGPRVVVERMQRSTRRLTELVESLLEYTSLRSGRILTHAVDVDLGRMATEALDEARVHADQKGLELRLSVQTPPPRLRSDSRLVRLVLSNLVNNAVKFTERGSVHVSISAAGDGVRVSVADTGPGIAPEEQARIFKPFVHVEPSQLGHTPGVGLGLAIVRDLLSALGGKVAMESDLGQGSTFTVDFPTFE